MKKQYILLLAFVLIGLFLRCSNIDFPTIGYHNMKENEYVQETKLMLDNGDIIHRQTFTFFGLTDNNNFDEYAQPPLIPWMTLPLWSLFGEQIWIPRLIIILFSLASILMTYFVVNRLTKSEFISLLSSFFFAIMPIGTFFGRNIQPEMPGLFFVLLSLYLFIDWVENNKKKILLFSMLSMSLACLFKETYLITLLPMLFLVPWNRLIARQKATSTFADIGIAIAGLIPYYLVIKYFDSIIVDRTRIQMESFAISFERAMHPEFWQSVMPSIVSFLNDNFTMWFVFFAICGMLFAVSKFKTLLGKYTIGTIVTLIIYLGIVSGKVGGHSYYHMPFLPIVCILSAYFFYVIGNMLPNSKVSVFIPLLLILATIPAINDANVRVFGTNFYGQDVIGEWINPQLEPGERLFAMATSQEYAVCTYARTFCGEWTNESDMKYLEDKYNIKFLYISTYRMGDLQTNKAWSYIEDNYHIAFAGFLVNNNQPMLYNMVLEKGGNMNMSDLGKQQPYLAKIYKTSFGEVPYYVVTP